MPRNSGGTYSLPAGNPVVTGTTVSSTWANSTLADIAAELTNSVARDGSGSMDEALLLTNGTASAPSLAFASETTTGIYLEGAQDMRLQVNATNAIKMTAANVTIPLGLVVTQDTPDGSAVTGTANGNGYGGDFNAATSTGAGVRGTGVGTGTGGTFVGGATGPGVTGTGGATSGTGVLGIGTAASAGVTGTGGPTSGTGVAGVGGAPNGTGVLGTGTGTGGGVLGNGGATDGTGVKGVGGGTIGTGVEGRGAGSGEGGEFYGGPNAGNGVEGIGGTVSGLGGTFVGGAPDGTGLTGTGAGNGAGGKFYNVTGSSAAAVEGWSASASSAGGFFSNTSTGAAVQVNQGHAKFTGTNPASTAPYENTLTPTNIVKAWGYITTAGGGSTSGTVVDGFNISSTVNLTSAVMTITLAIAMPNTNYAVIVSPTSGSVSTIGAHLGVKTASTFTIGAHKESGGSGQSPVNLTTDAIGISFIVMGRQ